MNNKLLIFIIIILIIISISIKPKEVLIEHKDIEVLLDNNNKLSLQDYLIGVVGCEMPASFNYEALKAQAVASRTSAYNYLKDNVINITSSAQCYSDNTTLKDKWQNNYDKYYSTIKNAVEETNDKVITYQGNIIKSYYFAISNGKTSTALSVFNEKLPYLTNVDSTFDEGVNKYEVTTTFTYDNFCNLLNINPCNITISNIKRDESNRITSLLINNKEYNGITIRKLLGLRSTDFDIKLLDNIEITTRGYGHGVGMSQYGANYLANNNYTYEDIIKYYYKDVEITSIN
jgi:stage II sporulation protein D